MTPTAKGNPAAAAARNTAEQAALTETLTTWEGRDPDRARMAAAVLRYRAAWRELAEALEDCDRRELWKGWGFDSFEDYCLQELRLSRATLSRYRSALAFLRDFDVPPSSGVPLQGVEVARKALEAGENGEIDAADAGDIVTRALEGTEGPRQLAQDLDEARGRDPNRGYQPRLFGGARGPDPVALAKARKAWARMQAAAQPLREQMPAPVLDALQVVASYLSGPAADAADAADAPTEAEAAPPAEAPAPDSASDEGLEGDAAELDTPIPYVLSPTAGALGSGKDEQPEPRFETSAAQDLMEPAAELEDSGAAAVPETTYEREDGGPQAPTAQGQELLRRCTELLWLKGRASAEDLEPARAGLQTIMTRLGDEDLKALRHALGGRWSALQEALNANPGPGCAEDADCAEVVYDT